MKTGLCSIAFRQIEAEGLVELVRQSGLDAIEWGGDVHVPPGDAKLAEATRIITEDAGLEVASYGSYYRVLDADGTPIPFEPVLETALALGTDTIRIWAGQQGSHIADEQYKQILIDETLRVSEMAQQQGVRLGLEFHAGTLTDSNASTLAFLDATGHPNLYTYWQPSYWLVDLDCRIDGLVKMSDRVSNLHVFHWDFNLQADLTWEEATDRRPLEEGIDEWRGYFQVALNPAFEHYALLEFVRDDDPAQFLRDAAVLRQCVEEYT